MEEKKEKQNLNEIVRIEKRNVVAIAGYHLFSSLLGILAILSGYFYLTTNYKLANAYKWVMLSVVLVSIVALFLFIRFYKNKNVVAITKKDLLINKIITYIYLIPLIAFIALVMISKKQLAIFFDGKTHVFKGNATDFQKAIIPFQVGQFLAGSFLFGFALSLFGYDLFLAIKKDTKISIEQVIEEENKKREQEESEGKLQSEEIKEENTANKEEDKKEKTNKEDK